MHHPISPTTERKNMSSSQSAHAPQRASIVKAVHASKVATRNGSAFSTAQRRDPYWDQLWVSGSQAIWATRAAMEQRSVLGEGRVNQKFLLTEQEALENLSGNYSRRTRQNMWAVVDSWRTISAEQAAAFTGAPALATPTTLAVASSFAIGLIDIGTLPMAIQQARGFDSRALYRPSNTDAYRELIAPTLTYPERLQITGGYPWASGGQYDRHNVLAAELALRAAEHLAIGGVLGEKFASVDLLAGSGIGRTLPKPDNRRADGVILRPDGMRIAVEITATASNTFKQKVRRWAQLLTERPLETSGLTILFVTAPHSDRIETGRDPRKAVYQTITEVLREFPGTGRDSPAARIGLASWDQWFPGRHLLSKEFFEMRADFALEPGKRGKDKWVSKSMLTEIDFQPWRDFDATAVIDNQGLLGATPFWFRTGDHTHLIGTPLQRQGLDIPQPEHTRPSRSRGMIVGQPRGVATKVNLPERLRIHA
jgi:hypothetical protein